MCVFMKFIEEIIPQITNLLVTKAARRSAIRYSAIYRFFDKDTPRDIVWETFEEACRRIAPTEEAIYGALMVKKGTGLPGDGFYDIFKNKRLTEYLEVTGGVRIESNELNIEQMKKITQIERERVHAHAASIT